MVFQQFNLFPHPTVMDNLSRGASVRHRPRAEAEQRARELLSLKAD
jgi:polar amino acid transport system ATP-binding protein